MRQCHSKITSIQISFEISFFLRPIRSNSSTVNIKFEVRARKQTKSDCKDEL